MLIIRQPILTDELLKYKCEEGMVKMVVDISREVIAVAETMHAEGEAALVDDGSREEDLWGILYHPDRPAPERIVYEAMNNIRPYMGNSSRYIENPFMRDKIGTIIVKLIQ